MKLRIVSGVVLVGFGLLLYLVRRRGLRRQPMEVGADGSFLLGMSRDLDAPIERVWPVLADFQHVDRFHPYVTSVDGLSPHACGVGATRRCNLAGMPSVTEEVSEWIEGRGYRIRGSSKMDFLGALEGGLWVEALDDKRTRARFELKFRPRLGFVGRLFGRLWLAAVADGMGPHILAGLDHHLRTGGKLGRRPL